MILSKLYLLRGLLLAVPTMHSSSCSKERAKSAHRLLKDKMVASAITKATDNFKLIHVRKPFTENIHQSSPQAVFI